MKKAFLLIFSSCLFLYTQAQLPKTEIYVFDLMKKQEGWKISNPQKVALAEGYNNQPHFTPDGKFMLFVSSGKENGLTDIYRYDLEKKRIKRLTKTKLESEYSPQITPSRDKISCVRVESDTTTQAFYTYNLRGKSPRQLLPELETIGYYTWVSSNELLTFNVPEPFTFNHYYINSGQSDSLGESIGRCMLNNKSRLYYVDKSDSLHWQIKVVNRRRWSSRKMEAPIEEKTISSTIEGQEDFAFLPDGSLLMGDGGVIFQKHKVLTNPNAQWDAIFDLNQYGITEFYRIVVSRNYQKIAVVSIDSDDP